MFELCIFACDILFLTLGYMCVSRPTHYFLADRLRFFIGDHIEKKWSKSDHFERSYEVLKTKLGQ